MISERDEFRRNPFLIFSNVRATAPVRIRCAETTRVWQGVQSTVVRRAIAGCLGDPVKGKLNGLNDDIVVHFGPDLRRVC